METFRIIQPNPLLTPYIKQYWFLKTTGTDCPVQRIVPAGSINLIFHRGDLLYSISENDYQPRTFLCGQTTGYGDLVQKGAVDMITVVFTPVGAGAFFRMPMSKLNDTVVSIDESEDSELKELSIRMCETFDDEACARLADTFFLKRLSGLKYYNYNRLNAVVCSVNHGVSDVNLLAQTACLSYKQFNRIFSEHVGARPKDFLRIVRFQRALYHMQMQPSTSLTALALECGFYDQSHLIREFKLFSGYTPGEYFSVCAPYSDYFS
jgi:AraC-like DNA-binding protein